MLQRSSLVRCPLAQDTSLASLLEQNLDRDNKKPEPQCQHGICTGLNLFPARMR